MIRAVARVLVASEPVLALQVPGWPRHRPGQFAMLDLNPRRQRLDPLLPRPMAIFSAGDERVEFRFRVVGSGTRILAELGEGDEIGILGPLGNGFPEPTGRAVLVGGGTGIASLRELAARAASSRVLLGARKEADLLGLDAFRRLGVDLGLATEDGSAGHKGLVTDLLRLAPGDEVFACGPTPMLRAVRQMTRDAGIRCWVSLESRMACGFGVCLGCAVETRAGFRYVCSDGPVFEAESLDWERLP